MDIHIAAKHLNQATGMVIFAIAKFVSHAPFREPHPLFRRSKFIDGRGKQLHSTLKSILVSFELKRVPKATFFVSWDKRRRNCSSEVQVCKIFGYLQPFVSTGTRPGHRPKFRDCPGHSRTLDNYAFMSISVECKLTSNKKTSWQGRGPMQPLMASTLSQKYSQNA